MTVQFFIISICAMATAVPLLAAAVDLHRRAPAKQAARRRKQQ